MATGFGDKAFTMNWLQALTLAAREPIAREIKPLLDTVADISRTTTEADRIASAKKLWDYAESVDCTSLLHLIPIQQPDWSFESEDIFIYRRSRPDEFQKLNFESWTSALGLTPCTVSLEASATTKEWTSLVRQEAVRLQKSINAGAVPAGLNQQLPCHATWDLQAWTVRFTEPDWVTVRYETPFSVQRPQWEQIEESLTWMIAQAQDSLIPKALPKFATDNTTTLWLGNATSLEPLHRRILTSDAKHYQPWFRRAWAAVWPVVYREQNILRGQANIETIRQELAECIKHVPKLTIWLFFFGKLLCENQLGRGLGTCGDYVQ